VSDANVQVVKQLYGAMGQSDISEALAVLDEDVTFVIPGPPNVGAAGTWRGHDGVRTCLQKLRESQENQSVDFREFVDGPNTVVVLLTVKAKVRATGKIFASDIIHFFTLRDGKIVRLLDFFDTAALVDAHKE
jgi:ketosteroid isomerase-like protein